MAEKNDNVVFIQDLKADEAKRRLSELVREGQYVLTNHALNRMAERDITDAQISRVLLGGSISEAPRFDYKYESWTFNIEGTSAGTVVRLAVSLETVGRDESLYDQAVVRTVINVSNL